MANHTNFLLVQEDFMYLQYCKFKTLQWAESYFQVGTQESLQKISRCWKNSVESTDWINYCWSCSKIVTSLYLVCTIHEGTKFDAEVRDVRLKLSPLEHGQLRIPIKVSVAWDSSENTSILVDKIRCRIPDHGGLCWWIKKYFRRAWVWGRRRWRSQNWRWQLQRHSSDSLCVCVLLVALRKIYSQIKKKPIVFPAFQQLACKNLKMSQINQGLFYTMH